MGNVVYFIHAPDFSCYYIGSTNSARRRFKHHRTMLRSGRHANLALQRAFAKYGEDRLIFSIAAELPTREAANELEGELLRFHHRKPGCLNVSSAVMAFYCPEVTARRVASIKSTRCRAAAAEKARAWIEENPAQAAAAFAKSATTRRGEAWREANRQRGIERTKSEASKTQFASRMKAFYARGGVVNAKAVIGSSGSGEEALFPSASAAGRAMGARSGSAISLCCTGQRNTAYGLRWRFA